MKTGDLVLYSLGKNRGVGMVLGHSNTGCHYWVYWVGATTYQPCLENGWAWSVIYEI